MSFETLLSRITSLWIAIAVISGCAGATSEPDTMGDFCIYLVKQGVSAQQMMKMDLSQLELDRSPVLSDADIVTYTWETHEIELTEPARERVARLEVPMTTGVPFVVCVGDERIYGGAFWVSSSSMSFQGIVIDTLFAKMDDHPIRIQLGYPESPERFEGEDLRSDPRILRSLTGSGKLW
jgi:hypothetical protein